MSKPVTSATSLNPKRASGEGSSVLNPKRASGGATKAATSTTPAAKSTTTAAAASTGSSSLLKKKVSTDSTAAVTKQVAGLKVGNGGDSPPGEKRRITVGRRRGDDEESSSSSASAAAPASSSAASAASSAAASSSASSTTAGSTTLSAAKANQARRRLSITAGKEDASKLDGHSTDEVKDPLTKVLKSMSVAQAAPAQAAASPAAAKSSKRRTFSHYTSLSKVGYVPFNPNKVNQDRSVEVVKFGGNDEKALFGVFDGHGALGHEVSSFLIQELPKFFLKQANLDTNPHEAITKAFVDCNVKLASSSIDCTFSGSTGIVVYLANNKIYSCNAGDSRAVLARATAGAGGELKYQAVPLSSDQKPEREDEKKRILENKGRVEACKGLKGEDIGPPRVWLSHQDVPGLAMSRSFGDLIAASVGVIAKPEIWERDVNDGDKFMILASDGVWEFISNEEAVDLVVKANAKSGPEDAAKALVDEATKRWHAEEEVVDDITCILVFF